MEISMRVVEK